MTLGAPAYLLDWHVARRAQGASAEHTYVPRRTVNHLRVRFGVNVGLRRAERQEPSPRSTAYCLLNHKEST